MINSAINDAVALCSNILNSISPSDKYIVINIAKNKNNTFTYTSLINIPTSFGYNYDKVPQILEEKGVILAKLANRWHINKTTTLFPKEVPDCLDEKGYEVNLLKKGEVFAYYGCRENSWSRASKTGPLLPGQFATIISISALNKFYSDYFKVKNKTYPEISDSGIFKFADEIVEFRGELEIKTLKILLNNINSIVPKKDLISADPSDNYEQSKEQKNLVTLHDKLKKRIDAIKQKLHTTKTPLTTRTIIFANNNGYGIFIDQQEFKKAQV